MEKLVQLLICFQRCKNIPQQQAVLSHHLLPNDPFSCPLPTTTICCSHLVLFRSSAFQGAANVSVLTVMPGHVSTERLALVTRSFVTSFTATCARSRSLVLGFPTTPCAMSTCWHKRGYYPTEDLALACVFGFFSCTQKTTCKYTLPKEFATLTTSI